MIILNVSLYRVTNLSVNKKQLRLNAIYINFSVVHDLSENMRSLAC